MIKLVNSAHQGAAHLERARAALARLRERKDLGYLALPFRDENWSLSIQIAETLRNKAENLVVVGMGGSALGGKALVDTLGAKTVEFLHNTDPRSVSRFLDNFETIEKSHFLVISKSGNTLEISAILMMIVARLKAKKRPLEEAITIITENKSSALFNFAKANKIHVGEHPMDVGGRFSVFTPVGLVPAAFSGLDLGQLRQGAIWATEESEMAVELSAIFLESFERGEGITVFWSYIDRLQSFLPWLVQLWAESLGKARDRKGNLAPKVSTPISALGASDQHSVLQQFMDGPADKFFLFISEDHPKPDCLLGHESISGFEYLQGKSLSSVYDVQSKSTEEALWKAERATARLKITQVNEEALGALLMLFELIIGVLGEALDLNAFDQPGVELGKKIAKEKLTGI